MAKRDNEVIGVVENSKVICAFSEPNVYSVPVCDIDCGTELLIDLDKSTDEFYSVCTAAGIECYCLRTFVRIKQ